MKHNQTTVKPESEKTVLILKSVKDWSLLQVAHNLMRCLLMQILAIASHCANMSYTLLGIVCHHQLS